MVVVIAIACGKDDVKTEAPPNPVIVVAPVVDAYAFPDAAPLITGIGVDSIKIIGARRSAVEKLLGHGTVETDKRVRYSAVNEHPVFVTYQREVAVAIAISLRVSGVPNSQE